MPHIRAGAASIHDPKQWRAEDRVACGEHAWAVLSGTTHSVGMENEADAAAPVAEAIVRSSVPPSLDAMLECFLAMDRAVIEWAGRSDLGLDGLWGCGLGAVLLAVDGDVVRIAHVGTLRAYRLTVATDGAPLIAEALTVDHSFEELARRRSDLGVRNDGDPSAPLVLSSLGHGHVPRIDLTRVELHRATRLVLVSRGARPALDTPLGYLREIRSPVECAQRLCAEARTRAGESPHHASAIVVDVDPEPATGPYR